MNLLAKNILILTNYEDLEERTKLLQSVSLEGQCK